MRWGLVPVLLGACSFEHGRLSTSDALPTDAPADAAFDASNKCLDGWCLRKTITIHGNEVQGAQVSFVLLVRETVDAELAVASTGPDIRFTTYDGQALAYERQRYVSSTGELVAWVKLPTLAPTTDTTLFMYYGKTGAPDQQDRVATWMPDHAGVWHLDEAASATTLGDASGNGNTGTPLNATTRLAANGPTLGAPGVFGRAVAYDGVDDEMDVAKSTSLSSTNGNATFSFWIKWTSLTAAHYQRVLSSSNRFNGGVNEDGYELAAQPGGDFFLYPWGGAEDYNLGPNPFTAGEWQYFVATLDITGPSVKMYVNAVPMTFTAQNEALWTMPGDPGDWCWGSNAYSSSGFGGSLDEIRVMRGARSAGWVATSFANQKPDSTMVTIGPEQMLEP